MFLDSQGHSKFRFDKTENLNDIAKKYQKHKNVNTIWRITRQKVAVLSNFWDNIFIISFFPIQFLFWSQGYKASVGTGKLYLKISNVFYLHKSAVRIVRN